MTDEQNINKQNEEHAYESNSGKDNNIFRPIQQYRPIKILV